MRLYIFNYQGTLTTLEDPVGFITALRGQNPDCKIVIWSGSPKDQIDDRTPGLIDAVDDLWAKPGMLHEKVEGGGEMPDEIFLVEDDPTLRQAAKWSLFRYPAPVHSLDEHALAGLVKP